MLPVFGAHFCEAPGMRSVVKVVNASWLWLWLKGDEKCQWACLGGKS
jgi:hypothetical protein